VRLLNAVISHEAWKKLKEDLLEGDAARVWEARERKLRVKDNEKGSSRRNYQGIPRENLLPLKEKGKENSAEEGFSGGKNIQLAEFEL